MEDWQAGQARWLFLEDFMKTVKISTGTCKNHSNDYLKIRFYPTHTFLPISSQGCFG